MGPGDGSVGEHEDLRGASLDMASHALPEHLGLGVEEDRGW